MALWTPADLDVAPRVWIDGDDAVFSGSNLSSITSKGADGAAMTIGSTAPTKATLNSLNGINCLANNQHVRQTVSAWGSGGKLFCFTVAKKRVSPASNYAFITGHGAFPAGGDIGYLIDDDSSGGPSLYTSGYPGPTYIEKLSAIFGTAAHVFAAQVGSSVFFRLNGSAVTGLDAAVTGTVPNYSSRTWWFGAGGSTDSSYMDGALFQLVLLDYFPTTDELERLEGWAAWKYGLEGNLPSGHTYKSAAPTTSTDVTGTLAATLGLSMAASGTHIAPVTGTLAGALGLSMSASGAHGVSGALNGALGLTMAASGTHVAPVTGALAGALGLSMSASGAHGVAGALAASLSISMDATGSFAPSEVTGTLAATLAVVLDAAGVRGVGGTLASTLGLAMDASGTFAQDVTGELAATLGLTLSAAGVYGIVRETSLIPPVNNLEQVRKIANAILSELQSYLPSYGGALPDVDSVPDGKLFVRNDEAQLYQKQNGAWVAVDGTP